MDENKVTTITESKTDGGMTPEMFEAYKRTVNLDDIKKMEYKLKPRWYENLPILGSMIYGIRMTIKLMGIDRGLLRKEIFKVRLLFTFLFLIYIYAALSAITPWFNYWQYRIAIKKALKRINENNLILV